MPAPLGNKYAVGADSGRPGYDRIKIGEEFVEYARNNPSCLTVPCFAATKNISSDTMITWCKENQEFRQLYKRAKELIGINRLLATQDKAKIKIDTSLYKGTLHHYDFDVLEDIHQEKIFESNLRKQEEGVKQTNITLQVPHGLAIGSNIPTEAVPIQGN